MLTRTLRALGSCAAGTRSCAVIASVALCALAITTQSPAVAARVQHGSRTIRLETVGELPASQKRWALVIGVDEYTDEQITGLRGAANDAKLLAVALVAHAGFPADQVIVLATGEPNSRLPTRTNILKLLSNLSASVPKDGLLLVSFSGHGMERGGQAFLLPSDATAANDVSLLEETAISVVRMHDRIRATGVGQVLVLLDACRNDPTAGRADSTNSLTTAFTRGFDFDVANREVEAYATLFATSVGARAYEYVEKRQGYFTWAVIEGLKGAAADSGGRVTLSGLIRYVEQAVPKRVGVDYGAGKQQRPFARVEGYRADELVLAIAGASSPLASAPVVVDPKAGETALWNAIEASRDAADYEDYLKQYPSGTFAGAAKAKIRQLRAAASTGDSRPAPDDRPVLTRRPDDPASLQDAQDAMSRARAHFEAKRDAEALKELSAVLSARPDTAEAHLMRGLIFERTGEYDKAIESLKASTFWDPKVPKAIVALGRIYIVVRNDCAGAKSCLARALQLDPNNADAATLKRKVDAKCGR